jgi:hypothetical protein
MAFNDNKKPYYGEIDRQTRLNTDLRMGIMPRREVANTNYTPEKGDYLIVYTSLSAPRTISLSAAATYAAGQSFYIKDEAGAAATHNLTIDPSASETIDGAATQTISTNYGKLRIYTDGVSKWFTV